MKAAAQIDPASIAKQSLNAAPALWNARAAILVLLTIIGLACLCPTAANGQCAPTSAGLVAWWRAEGDASDSIGSHHGDMVGGATFAPGKVGNAFSFDGLDDYVEVPHSNAFNPAGPFSVELWIKASSLWNPGLFTVIGKQDVWLLGGENGVLVFGFPDIRAVGNTDVLDDEWHHVVGVYTGTQLELYVDGVREADPSPALALPRANTRPVRLGRLYLDIDWIPSVEGLIDEPTYYNRALSSAEVQAIYNADAAGKCTDSPPTCAPIPSDIVSWWRGEGNASDAHGDKLGSVQGDVSYVSGKVGQAFGFDGATGYLEIPGVFGGGREFTVEAWVKPAADTGDFQAIVSSTDPEFLHLQLFGAAGNIVVYTSSEPLLFEVLPVEPLGVWRHVALSIRSGDSRLYVDGQLVERQTGTFDSITPTSSLRIGSGYNGGRFFEGAMDEIGFFSRALTATEIQAIYQSGAAGKCGAVGIPSVAMAARDTMVSEHPGLGGPGATHGSDELLFSVGTPDWRIYPLVAFDLSSLVGRTVVGSPRFEFWLEGGWTGNEALRPVSVHPILTPWDEATTSFISFGGPLEFNIGAVGPSLATEFMAFLGDNQGYRSWPLPAAVVQGWIDNPTANHGLLVLLASTEYHQDLVFASRESVHPPRLVFSTSDCLAPAVAAHPRPQSVCTGSAATFRVLASGTTPLAYQWLKDGDELMGATDAALTLPAVQLGDVGRYTVRVSNACGTVESLGAELTLVDAPPVVTLNGPSAIVLEACLEAYEEWGATVQDDCTSGLAVAIGGDPVNTSVPGNYVVRYTATDGAGQTVQASREVNVRDTTAPVFTHVPGNLTVGCRDTGREALIQNWLAAVTAADTCGSAVVENDLGAPGVCAVGSRTVTWTARDGHGNSATVSRLLTLTADGLLTDLAFEQNPNQITLSPDEQGQLTLQGVHLGNCPILLESSTLTGPANGPAVTISAGALPLTLCPGGVLSLSLQVNAADVVPGNYPYFLTLAGSAGGPVQVQIEVVVVGDGLPDLTANQPGGGVMIIPDSGPLPPSANEPFTLRARLFNTGGGNASPFKVRYFEGATLLDEQAVNGLNAGGNTQVDLTVPGGRPAGYYLFRLEIVPPVEGELTLANNQASALVQVGDLPVGAARLVVRARAHPDCGVPTSVFVTGTAEYEFVSPLGTARYPVKGGQVTLRVVGGGTVNAGHTLVDGTFSGYVSAPAANTYTVMAMVTDSTLSGEDELTYAIPAADCPVPGGVLDEPGTPSEKLPHEDRNLYLCNGDFAILRKGCVIPVEPGNVPVDEELCLQVTVHYYEAGGDGAPFQPVFLTAFEQVDGAQIAYPMDGAAVAFKGGGSASAKFSWTPPHAGTFILRAQINPTFPQGIEDDVATRTIVVGPPDETPTQIRVTAQGVNVCSADYQAIIGRAVYRAGTAPAHPVVCGDVLVSVYRVTNPDDPLNSRQFLGVGRGRTDRFGNFSINPRIQVSPGESVFVVEVTDGTLTGLREFGEYCPPPVPGGASPDTPSDAPVDVFVYSEDIGFLGPDCLSPLNRWPLPGEPISIAADIHYYGPSPEPALPVDVSVLLPVGDQLVRQLIGTTTITDWQGDGLLCLPWTPLALGPQIVEVATRPDRVPLSQFTGNDAATRLIFVGEVDCQLAVESGSILIEAGQTAAVNVAASRVAGEGSLTLSAIHAGEGNLPAGMTVSLADPTIAFSESTAFVVQSTEAAPSGLYRFVLLGNSDTCQALATVNVRVVRSGDTTPPQITCPVIAEPLPSDASCRALVPDVTAKAVVSDDLTAPGDLVVTQMPAPGTSVGMGDHEIVLTVKDAAGNTASCTTSFTVRDATPPSIVCPAASEVAAGVNCQAAVPNLAASAQASDCGGMPVVTQEPAAGTVVGLGERQITVTATDAAGNSASCVVVLTVVDRTGPAFACPNPVELVADDIGQARIPNLTQSLAASDCSEPVGFTQSPAVGTTVDIGTHSVLVTATDARGNSTSCAVSVIVSGDGNAAPVVTIEQPTSAYLSATKQPIQFTGRFIDDGPAGSHSAQWVLTTANQPPIVVPGTVAGFGVSDPIVFPTAGIYSIKLVVMDSEGASGDATTVLNELPAYVVVYDANGGFVTGGGWIWSPRGAFHPGLQEFAGVEGRAHFALVSRYKKGATAPTGQAEFQFEAAELRFRSSSYQWLVVSGARAQFKGTGTINGAGNYGFLLTAIDGQVTGGGGKDRFRIKIWEAATGTVVYDNQPGSDDTAALNDATLLGGGSVVIHTGK